MTDHHRIVVLFCATFEAAYKTKYPFAHGKDGKIIKDMISIYGAEETAAIINQYFKSDYSFLRGKVRSLGLLRGVLPAIAAETAREKLAAIHNKPTPVMPKPPGSDGKQYCFGKLGLYLRGGITGQEYYDAVKAAHEKAGIPFPEAEFQHYSGQGHINGEKGVR